MHHSVPSSPRRQVNHRRRLLLHVTIGMFMVSVAVGGYMFFGPASKTASGAHDRPANVATSIPVTEQVTTATLPITSVDPTYTDLDSMRAEMAAIHNRVTAMLEQAQPLRSATDPMIDNPAGSVGPIRTRIYGGE